MTSKEINRKCRFILPMLLALYFGCNTLISKCQKPGNANYYELSFKVNTPRKFGNTYDVVGTVVKKHRATNNGITGYFVTLVNNNSTFRVKVLEKPVYDLIGDGQKLVLKNCIILKLKQ